MHPKIVDIYARGYCVLEAVYSAGECDEIRRILNAVWQHSGQPAMGGRFGFVLHPLLKYAPEMASFYLKEDVLEVLSLVLQDDVKLAHSGALICDETRDFCDWHYHRDERDEETMWNTARSEHLNYFDRVLCNVYLDGSNDEVGPLVAYPRQLSAPWGPPSTERQGNWPGQEIVYCPPGSAVIFDTALFHAARQPQKKGRRYLFGGHYQGRHNTTPHREDNRYDGPEMDAYKKEHALFRP